MFYTPDGYRPEDSIGFLMRQALNSVRQQIERQLAHTDLTNAQWIPLYKLYASQASTVAELARACQLDNGAMTRMLDRLEAKGLCSRVRSKEDRRVVNIVLPEAGKVAASEIPRILCGVQNANLQGFSPEEFDTLKSLLRRILANAMALESAEPIHPPHNNRTSGDSLAD